MVYSFAILLISVIVIVLCWRKKGMLRVAGLTLLALALAVVLFFAIFDTIIGIGLLGIFLSDFGFCSKNKNQNQIRRCPITRFR